MTKVGISFRRKTITQQRKQRWHPGGVIRIQRPWQMYESLPIPRRFDTPHPQTLIGQIHKQDLKPGVQSIRIRTEIIRDTKLIDNPIEPQTLSRDNEPENRCASGSRILCPHWLVAALFLPSVSQ